MPRPSSTEVALGAAYRCFCRQGLARTSMSDIVTESGLSRPTVYKYLGSTTEAFARLTQSRLEMALAAAGEAADAAVCVDEKLLVILQAKLELAITLWTDAPFRAYELLAIANVETPELIDAYLRGLSDLLTAALEPAVSTGAREIAEVLLIFTRGLEDDLTDPHAARAQLTAGVRLITRGALSGAAL